VEYVNVEVDIAQKSFNDHFNPWVKQQVEKRVVHWYKFRKMKKENDVF